MARKKNTYRLQIVLDRKAEARDAAARYLAEKKEDLRREQEEEARLQKELDKNRERHVQEYDTLAREGMSNGLSAQGAQQRLNFIKRLDREADVLRDRISNQQARVAQAEADVKEALEVLINASRELQVMEKHKEKWQKKLKKAQDLAEQKEMNEIGNVMYNANRTRGYQL